MFRLIDGVADLDRDCARCADAVARILAEELGDGAGVVLMDPPGHSGIVVGAGHRDPDRLDGIRNLANQAPAERTRELCREIAARGEPVVTASTADLEGSSWAGLKQWQLRYGFADLLLAPMRDEAGGSPGLVILARDAGSPRFSEAEQTATAAVTNRLVTLLAAARARHAQRLADLRWRAAFESSPVGMAMLDPSGRLVEANASLEGLTGEPVGRLIGRPWLQFLPTDDSACRLAWSDDLLTGRVPNVVNTTHLVRPDGSLRWVQLVGVAVRDEASQIEAFHVQVVDLDDLRAAQEEADLLAQLVHSSTDFIIAGTPDERVAFVNKAGRSLVGMPDDVDVTTTVVSDFFSGDSLVGARDEIRPAVLRDGSWRGTSTLRDWRDDSLIPVLVSAFLIHGRHSREPVGLGAVISDVREQVESRRALERLAEHRRKLLGQLLTAERDERTRIAGEVHDESVQLLAAAQLRVHLLEQALRNGDAAAASAAVGAVEELVGSSMRHLRALLLDLEEPPVDTTVATALGEIARRFFDGTNTVIDLRGDLEKIDDDAAAVLVRVGREALANARRHADAGHVQIRLDRDEREWRMVIRDDGIGFTRRPRERGHLGLSSMHARIQALGGSCDVSAVEPSGTEVTCTIPVG